MALENHINDTAIEIFTGWGNKPWVCVMATLKHPELCFDWTTCGTLIPNQSGPQVLDVTIRFVTRRSLTYDHHMEDALKYGNLAWFGDEDRHIVQDLSQKKNPNERRLLSIVWERIDEARKMQSENRNSFAVGAMSLKRIYLFTAFEQFKCNGSTMVALTCTRLTNSLKVDGIDPPSSYRIPPDTRRGGYSQNRSRTEAISFMALCHPTRTK